MKILNGQIVVTLWSSREGSESSVIFKSIKLDEIAPADYADGNENLAMSLRIFHHLRDKRVEKDII